MRNDSYPSTAALRQFVEIQRAGGIAGAARRLNLTQPALSRNIKKLESIVGAPLLDRHTRGASLTPAGQSLFNHAIRVLVELEHGLEAARKTAGIARNEVKIGAGVVFAHTVVPEILPAFEAELPNCRVTVITMPFEDIERNLVSHRVDICAHGIPTDHDGVLKTQAIHTANRALLCAPNHPLNQTGTKVSVSEISQYPFVSFSPDRHQMKDIDRLFQEHMLTPPFISMEADLLSSSLKALRHNRHLMYGSSLLGRFAINQDLAVLQTAFDLGRYEIGFSYLADSEPDYAAKRFMAIAKNVLSSRVESAK